jgi:hypothetical protein
VRVCLPCLSPECIAAAGPTLRDIPPGTVSNGVCYLRALMAEDWPLCRHRRFSVPWVYRVVPCYTMVVPWVYRVVPCYTMVVPWVYRVVPCCTVSYRARNARAHARVRMLACACSRAQECALRAATILQRRITCAALSSELRIRGREVRMLRRQCAARTPMPALCTRYSHVALCTLSSTALLRGTCMLRSLRQSQQCELA